MTRARVFRSVLRHYQAVHYRPGVLLLVLDLSLYAALFVAICVVPWWWAKGLLGVTLGIVIGRLFQLGHTASHRALFPQGKLNRLLSRPVGVLCLLPSLMPEWSWDVAHNRIHHVLAQHAEGDSAWRPLSPQAFATASWARRLRERLSRSLIGLGWHYFYIDWCRLFIPHMLNNLQDARARTDLVLLLSFTVGQVVIASSIGGPWWLNLLMAWVLPFVIWNYILAFVSYFHHTHEGAIWYLDGNDRPSLMETAFECSRNVTLPWRLDLLLHSAMVHTVHHLSPLIPTYRQREATTALFAALGEPLIVDRITWRRAWVITAHCQLYDYQARRWVRFAEVPRAGALQTLPAE